MSRSRSCFSRGLWYSGTILAILGCHELGHYFACRYYDVDASLPYFLPVPVPADRHARRLHPHPRADPDQAMLFDIGIAGPIAGFLVAVPALFVGLAMSHVVAPAAPTSSDCSSSASRCCSSSRRGCSGARRRTATR